MKRAVALFRKGKTLLQGYSRTTAGVWVGMGHVYVVDGDLINELGVKVQDALNESMEGVPHPSQVDWKNIQAPMLEAAGVKTWANLAKGTKSVGIEYDGAVVKMIPSSLYKNDGGVSLPEKTIRCEFSEIELGNSLMKAFLFCDG